MKERVLRSEMLVRQPLAKPPHDLRMEGLRIVTATLAVTGRHLHHRQVGVQLQ